MAGKKVIRQNIIEKRNALTMLQWQEKTDRITMALTSHSWFREAFLIYCYADFNGEVGTSGILEEAFRLGKQVAVPKVSGNRIEFYYICSLAELTPGTFGIPEPSLEAVKAEAEGLMIMPGVAFDRNRNRIGYGKGYYDRYLYRHPGLNTVALGFDLQLVEDIPVHTHDIQPKLLITESQIVD